MQIKNKLSFLNFYANLRLISFNTIFTKGIFKGSVKPFYAKIFDNSPKGNGVLRCFLKIL